MLPKSDQAVERYRTLGLAIEAAVVLDHWSEVDSLILERDQILSDFSSGQMTLSEASKQQMKACDHRLLQFLIGAKSETANELRRVRDNSNARRAYQPGSEPNRFSEAG